MEDWIYGKRRSQSGPTKITAGMRNTDSWKLQLLSEELNKIETKDPQMNKNEGFQIALKDNYEYKLLYDIMTGNPITNIGDIKYFSFDSSNTILWTVTMDSNIVGAIHLTKELLNPTFAARAAIYRDAASRIANVPLSEVETITLSAFMGSICVYSIDYKTIINYPEDNKLLHSLDGKLSITPSQIPTLPNLVWKKDEHGNHTLILVVNQKQYDKKWIPKINSWFRNNYTNKYATTQRLVWDIMDLERWFKEHERENLTTFQKVKKAVPTVLKWGIPLALSPALLGAAAYAYHTIPAVATAVGAVPTFASTVAKGIGKMYGLGLSTMAGRPPTPAVSAVKPATPAPAPEPDQGEEPIPDTPEEPQGQPQVNTPEPVQNKVTDLVEYEFPQSSSDTSLAEPSYLDNNEPQSAGFFNETLTLDQLVELANEIENDIDRKRGFIDGISSVGSNIITLLKNIPVAIRDWMYKETPVDVFYNHILEPRVVTKLDPSQSPSGFKIDETGRGIIDSWNDFLQIHTPSDPDAWMFNFIGEVQRLIDGKVDLYRCLYHSYTYDQVRKLLDIKWPQFSFTDNFFHEVFCNSVIWCIDKDANVGYRLTKWQKNNKKDLWNKNKSLILKYRNTFRFSDLFRKSSEAALAVLKKAYENKRKPILIWLLLITFLEFLHFLKLEQIYK